MGRWYKNGFWRSEGCAKLALANILLALKEPNLAAEVHKNFGKHPLAQDDGGTQAVFFTKIISDLTCGAYGGRLYMFCARSIFLQSFEGEPGLEIILEEMEAGRIVTDVDVIKDKLPHSLPAIYCFHVPANHAVARINSNTYLSNGRNIPEYGKLFPLFGYGLIEVRHDIP